MWLSQASSNKQRAGQGTGCGATAILTSKSSSHGSAMASYRLDGRSASPSIVCILARVSLANSCVFNGPLRVPPSLNHVRCHCNYCFSFLHNTHTRTYTAPPVASVTVVVVLLHFNWLVMLAEESLLLARFSLFLLFFLQPFRHDWASGVGFLPVLLFFVLAWLGLASMGWSGRRCWLRVESVFGFGSWRLA